MKQTYSFFDTLEAAQRFIAGRPRRKHSLQAWTSSSGTEHKYIVWYYE